MLNTLNLFRSIGEIGATLLTRYRHDDLGRRTILTRGIVTVMTNRLDPVSRLASLAQDAAGRGRDMTASFTRQPSGQIASVAQSKNAYGGARSMSNGPTRLLKKSIFGR